MNATVLNLKRKKKRERINRFIKIVNKFLDLYISIGTITRLIGIILIPIESWWKNFIHRVIIEIIVQRDVLFIKKKKKNGKKSVFFFYPSLHSRVLERENVNFSTVIFVTLYMEDFLFLG